MVRPRDPETTSRFFFIISFYISVLWFIFLGNLACEFQALYLELSFKCTENFLGNFSCNLIVILCLKYSEL